MNKCANLYIKEAEASEVFIIQEGEIYYYISNTDKYTLKGKNFVVGATELVLSHYLDIPTKRLETLYVTENSNVKKLSLEKFHQGVSNFSFLLNIAMVIARQVILTNDIIQKNKNVLIGKERDHKDICIEYYHIASILVDEYNKRKLPWLKNLVNKFQPSLTYKQGEIYAKAIDPVKIVQTKELDSKTIEISKGTTLCEEGTIGNELFILQSGAIDVLIKGNKVASISEPGSIIGEIALLLGEKRSATLKARNNILLTKINKCDLKEISVSDTSFFFSIVKSLSKKHYNNVICIKDLVDKVIMDELDSNNEDRLKMLKSRENSLKELSTLRKELSDILFTQDAPYLKERLAQYNLK